MGTKPTFVKSYVIGAICFLVQPISNGRSLHKNQDRLGTFLGIKALFDSLSGTLSSLGLFSMKNENLNGTLSTNPYSKEVARATRYSGLGVRSVCPVGDFLALFEVEICAKVRKMMSK